MSIRVVAHNLLREGAEAEFLALAKEIVEKTNALDEGCISYALCRSLQNPLLFTMIEEWKDQESLDKHMKAQHFIEIIPKMMPLTQPGGEGPAIFETVF